MLFTAKITSTKNSAETIAEIIEESGIISDIKSSMIIVDKKRLEVIMEIDNSSERHGRVVAEYICDETKKILESIMDEHLYYKVGKVNIR